MAHTLATRNVLVRNGVKACRCRRVMLPRRVSHKYRVYANRASPRPPEVPARVEMYRPG